MEQRNYDQRYQPYQRNNAHNQNKPYTNSHKNYNNNKNNNNRHNNLKYSILNETVADLYVHPYSKYDEPFPKFAQPTEVGVIISERNNIIRQSDTQKTVELVVGVGVAVA
jgi:hypothetical protein